MHRCLFIEGLPGSGKTTFSKRLQKYYENRGFRVKRYSEGDLHPIDLAWIAILDEKSYRDMLRKYPKLSAMIRSHTKKEHDRYYVAYAKIRALKEYPDFYKDFARFEIFRTEDYETFSNAFYSRWKHFGNHHDSDTIYIFECVLLQNHVNELVLKYGFQDDRLLTHLKKLLDCVRTLNPKILYIAHHDVEEGMRRVAKERISKKPGVYPDWFDVVVDYISSERFAPEMGYTGEEGVLRFFSDRQVLEKKLLHRLETSFALHILKSDYEDVWKAVQTDLDKSVRESNRS